MNEDFVPFELAVKLKEKGFNYPCISHYDINKKLRVVIRELIFWHSDVLSYIDAPSISQVLKWLREEKKIHITVLVITDCSKDADNNICEEWSFWSFYVTNLNDGSTVYDDFEKIDCIEYQSYKEATLAGIEYVLDNLL